MAAVRTRSLISGKLRQLLIALGVLLIAGLLWFAWALYHALDITETREIASIEIPNGRGMLHVFAIEPGALGQDCIQVRLTRSNQRDTILANIFGPSSLSGLRLTDGPSVELIIEFNGTRRDTILVP